MTTQEKIGVRIAELRKKKNLSQQKFANEADVERSFFTRIEKGEKNISVGTLERIFTALEISFQEFFNHEMFDASTKRKKKN